MKVLKFGGTSVGSSENINKVIQIVGHASENQSVVVVVSAVGGITDKLMNASSKAISKDLDYKSDFNKLKKQHIDIIEAFEWGFFGKHQRYHFREAIRTRKTSGWNLFNQ